MTKKEENSCETAPWAYTEIVKEHFLNPKNFLMGDEKKFAYNAKGTIGNPVCGDQMTMYLKIKTINHPQNQTLKNSQPTPNSTKSSAKSSAPKTTPTPNTTTEIIEDVKWKTYGCASAIASTSALSELAKGKTLDDALKISAQEIADYLGGLPAQKFHCSVLGHQALAAAINSYRQNLSASSDRSAQQTPPK